MHLSLIAASESSGSAWPTLIIFMLIPLAMYFLLIRPQKRRQRDMVSLQSSIEIGDEVMTTSGVYGFVTGFEGEIAWLEVDDNVQIRISRQAIQRKVDTAKGETATPTVDDVLNTKGKIEPAPGTEADD
jgi:preprotein translocase subunit YajC